MSRRDILPVDTTWSLQKKTKMISDWRVSLIKIHDVYWAISENFRFCFKSLWVTTLIFSMCFEWKPWSSSILLRFLSNFISICLSKNSWKIFCLQWDFHKSEFKLVNYFLQFLQQTLSKFSMLLELFVSNIK